jgi:ribose transport system permease protein
MSSTLPNDALHAAAPRRASSLARLTRAPGPLIAFGVLAALLLALQAVSAGPLSYFEVSFIASGGATLALAAIGQTIVVLSGGFDLSAGAVVALVNAVLATQMGASPGSQIVWGLAALAIGGAAGSLNGVLIAFLRLQPIVATLATMFILQGTTLLVMPRPGGALPAGFVALLTGDAIPDLLPAPLVVIAIAALAWLALKRSRLGLGIYAVGGDPAAAHAAGVSDRWALFTAYAAAGVFYGAAGAFVSAQTGSGDPLVGRPLLLQTFTAVVLGGTLLGGGRGGAIGSIAGAYALLLMVNILLSFNVPAYYSSIVEAGVLVLAVLAGSIGAGSVLRRQWRAGLVRFSSGSARPRGQRVAPPLAARTPRPGWWLRHRGALRWVAPAWGALALVLAVTMLSYGRAIGGLDYANALLVLGGFLLVLALGQGAVVLTGGLDLSLPWMITAAGILVCGLVRGADGAALWAIPAVLALGAVLGAANGLGIALLGLPPIVVTLGMGGLLQGAALLWSNGTPDGFASPTMRWFMTAREWGLAPAGWFALLFIAGGCFLLGRTVFGRRLLAVGNGVQAARLSAVPVGLTITAAYALSGCCAALAGILLASFSGQASLGMGDEYLLPSIAAVVVGGTLITGGRGHYLGMAGGALLLTALATLLAGSMLPNAVRDILFGLVVLAAVTALREARR